MPLTVPRAYDFIWSFQFLPLLTRKNSLASIIQLFSSFPSHPVLSLCFISSFIQLLLFLIFFIPSPLFALSPLACLQLTSAHTHTTQEQKSLSFHFCPFTHWFHLRKQKKGWNGYKLDGIKFKMVIIIIDPHFPPLLYPPFHIENFFVFRFKSFAKEKKDNRLIQSDWINESVTQQFTPFRGGNWSANRRMYERKAGNK